jgi:hypothetical protein
VYRPCLTSQSAASWASSLACEDKDPRHRPQHFTLACSRLIRDHFQCSLYSVFYFTEFLVKISSSVISTRSCKHFGVISLVAQLLPGQEEQLLVILVWDFNPNCERPRHASEMSFHLGPSYVIKKEEGDLWEISDPSLWGLIPPEGPLVTGAGPCLSNSRLTFSASTQSRWFSCAREVAPSQVGYVWSLVSV